MHRACREVLRSCLVIVVVMRTYLERSRLGRTLCMLILGFFLMLCGMHLVGLPHDADAESFGLVAQVLTAIVGLALLSGLLADPTKRFAGTQRGSARSRLSPVVRRRASDWIALETPLRC